MHRVDRCLRGHNFRIGDDAETNQRYGRVRIRAEFARIGRKDHSMRYGWLIVAGFAVLYTWLAFWAPLGNDFPPLWSNKDASLRWRIILVHALFLAAYMGVFGWLTWRESSFAWLARGSTWTYSGAAYLLVVGMFTAAIERLLFSRGSRSRSGDRN